MNSKYNFILKKINIEKIHIKYGIETDVNQIFLEENLGIKDEENNNKTTKLAQLNKDKEIPDIVSFLDETKRLHSCNISMIDFKSKMNINLLRYHCYWCRSPFNSYPIGCPINYVSNKAIKTYQSQISRNTYTIKEDITKKQKDNIEDNIEDNIIIEEGDYYETDGIFCSFNCCKAYIIDNKNNRFYNNSNILLAKLYNLIYNTKTINISPAPHWRTLEHYGGHLNIIKFRNNFNKIEYEKHGHINIPTFNSIGILYESKIKF